MRFRKEFVNLLRKKKKNNQYFTKPYLYVNPSDVKIVQGGDKGTTVSFFLFLCFVSRSFFALKERTRNEVERELNMDNKIRKMKKILP